MSVSLSHQQAIYWGKFIEVAIAMNQPGVSNPPQPEVFPEGWKLIANINAEAEVSFLKRREFMGFVAQSLEEPNKHAVILHGTKGIFDYLDDFEFVKEDFTLIPNGGQTEYGFTQLYESFLFVNPQTGESVNLHDYVNGLTAELSFTVAGISLGGALATLHAAVLAGRNISVAAYLFAAPMVGDARFVSTYNSLVSESYRIVNKPDIVPKLPGTLLGYAHVSTLFEVNSLEYPEIKRNIACFHAPQTYLYALGARDTDLASCKA